VNFDTVDFQDFKQKNNLSTSEALEALTNKIQELKGQKT
jgi:hypothetical protein